MGASIKLNKSANSTPTLAFASMRPFPAFKMISPSTLEPSTKRLVVDLEPV
jgi:hypothetical protein